MLKTLSAYGDVRRYIEIGGWRTIVIDCADQSLDLPGDPIPSIEAVMSVIAALRTMVAG